jgi:hypothetical protein
MKFELYSTSGRMADYISTLANNNFEFSGNDEYQVYVEIDSLKQLLKLKELLVFHDIIIEGKGDNLAIEIYDDNRE